jgi:hypothetical protein
MAVCIIYYFTLERNLLLFNLQSLKGTEIQTFREHKARVFSDALVENVTGNEYIWGWPS